MATYLELHALREDDDLLKKTLVAVTIAALNVKDDASPPGNQVDREAWAARALSDPSAMARKFYPLLLAANKDASVAAIQGASDAAILTAVEGAIDLFST